jgi:CRP/FNR family transcriptional regulator
MTDARKLADELAALPLLQGLPRELPRRIVELGSEQTFDAGEVLLESDRLGAECYILLEGGVRIDLPNGESKHEGSGNVIGELALLDTNRRTATVTTVTPVRAVVLHGSAFHQLLLDHPEFESRIRAHRA